MLDGISEQDTSFLDCTCKHKHMMKSGAPPDKFGILYRMVTYRIPRFTSRINSKGYHSLVPGLISIFVETLLVPLTWPRHSTILKSSEEVSR